LRTVITLMNPIVIEEFMSVCLHIDFGWNKETKMKLVVKTVERHIGIYSSRSKGEIRKDKENWERKCEKVKPGNNYASHFPKHCEAELSNVFQTAVWIISDTIQGKTHTRKIFCKRRKMEIDVGMLNRNPSKFIKWEQCCHLYGVTIDWVWVDDCIYLTLTKHKCK
jgi:hypothetical protein